MSTVEVKVSFDNLLATLTQLSGEQLEIVANRASIERSRQQLPHRDYLETELLQRIYAVVVPNDVREVYRRLTKKQRTSALYPAERQTLRAAIDQIELLNAVRLSHLTDLARLRQIELGELVETLEIKPLPYS